jgi:D-alanyl-D-alanine carboxypeptidase/D-alanyl-D-alanine-endopeptidase (penicillin-binding protein 4)
MVERHAMPCAMAPRWSSRFSLSVFAVACLLARDATPQAPAAVPGPVHDHVPELEAAVRAMVFDSTFKDAQIGVALMDVDSGHFLATANEHQALNPASNAKVYTAAAALAMLGGEHRYETVLLGVAKGSEVAGNLVLRGHGDPSLTTDDLYRLADELRGQGVRRISGDILVDQHVWDDQTTPPAFEQQPNEWSYFRAPVSAVAINENTLTFTVRPAEAGAPAHVSFDPPGYVDVDGTVTTGGEGADSVGLALAGNGKRMTAKVSGTVGADARVVRFTKRVEDPTLLAGYALRSVLETTGIKVAGDVKVGGTSRSAGGDPAPAKDAKDAGAAKNSDGTSPASPERGRNLGVTVLARHESAPLSQLLYSLGKQSDNFYAEMVFKTLGGEVKGRPGKSSDAADVVTRWVNKIGAGDTGLVIKNGSGLFDSNRTTATSMALLLRAMWRDSAVQPEFVAQLAVGGTDGTLHKRFREERHRHAIRAKTGTLDDTIALSGYVLGPPGKGPIAFSILMNKVAGKAGGARAAADKLASLVAHRLWGE